MARGSKATPLPPTVEQDVTAKHVALDRAVGDIIKRYGDGAIMRLGDSRVRRTDVISTGSLSLDIALGVGGIPRRRIT